MYITAYTYANNRIQRIMIPAKKGKTTVHASGITDGLEVSCDGAPPDKRIEDRPYSVYLTREEVELIVAEARKLGIGDKVP